jgi:hypothetical protein
MRIKKTSQTTPVQAEVVNIYSDSQENTYSCDYMNELNTYKTTEQRIGIWIDNKPIYRQVIDVTDMFPNGIQANTQVTKAYAINNFGNLINTKLVRVGVNPLEFKSFKYIQYINDQNRKDINIQIGASGVGISSGQYFKLILEYTKTTD